MANDLTFKIEVDNTDAILKATQKSSKILKSQRMMNL